MSGIARFWAFLIPITIGWSTVDLFLGKPSSALAIAMSGLVFLYLATHSDDVEFFG